MLPLRKRTAQAFALVLVVAGCVPLFWGLSVWIGALSFNFGRAQPPIAFRVLVLGSVPFGAALIRAGLQLLSWGRKP